MKTRIITGVVGAIGVIGWLFSMYTPVFAVFIAVVAAIGVFELTKAFEVKNPVFRGLCIAVSAALPFWFEYKSKLNIPVFPVVTLIVVASLITMVLDFEKLKFEQVACSLCSAVFVPSALSCIILYRDLYVAFPDKYIKTDGIFFILFGFFCCWLSDTFAFFAGKFFGKHKLSPVISPKKTVEGAIGGVIGTAIVNVILFFVFRKFYNLSAEITLPLIIIASVCLSVISIFGDLAASTIKRHHGIKDFGNLLPGHGGVMDRFDSSCFVFPVLYSIIAIINAI